MTALRAPVAEDVAASFPAATDDLDALTALLDGCTHHGVSRSALLVDLARLPAALARRPHLQLIATAIDPLLGHDRARLFRLADGHLVLIWRGAASAEADRAVHALDRLFAGLSDGEAVPPFGIYDLPGDAAAIAAVVNASVAPIEDAVAPPDAPKLDLEILGTLEAALAQADLAPFVRRLPVCACPAGQPSQLLWEKRTLALPALFAALTGGPLDTAAAPWLLRRLARTLDRRMLALLCDPAELTDAPPFALALNVASILSPAFLRFDAALPPALRGQVTLDLSPVELATDAASFAFARGFARTRGYRVVLCEVTGALLTVFPPASVGVDLVQLRFTSDLMSLDALPIGTNPADLILADIRHPSARDWGRRVGIARFQGPAIQPLIAGRVVNGRRRA